MLRSAAALCALLLLPIATGCASTPTSASARSPDGRLEVMLALHEQAGGAAPQYTVTYDGKPVVNASSLRMDFTDGGSLGGDCAIERVESTSLSSTWRQFPGKRSTVVDHCTETVVSLIERKSSRKWQLILRAYDDGAALRYRLPDQGSAARLEIAAERTQFNLPPGAIATALPLNSFTTSYEKYYQRKAVTEVPFDWLLGLPLLYQIPDGPFAAITEANLTDYAGMYLAREPGAPAGYVSRLSPLPGNPKVAVRIETPHATPWRIIMVAGRVESLVDSDIVLNLNEPCAFDTSWIHPGRTTFPWWNGFYEEPVAHQGFEMGLNTATAKHYIDFCAEAGIPCHSLDGIKDKAWYDGPITPYAGADITKTIAGLDMPEVLRYAKSKNVKIRLWMHWGGAKKYMKTAFPLYHQWGIEGVMIDFMDRDDQEMVNFLRDLLQTAADNHLTVTLHGMSKPTGLERTFPNLLNSEGVMNLEYDKWDKVGITPDHDTTIPFTRMLAGPLDFHQGSFRTVAVADFKPRNEAPLIMGTPCRTLATYVVFQNHMSMAADYPSAYREHPLTPVLASIPATWDETKTLAGAVGEQVVIARRAGDTWWIGAMTNGDAREIKIPLDFLPAGNFKAEIWRDAPDAKFKFASESRSATSADTLDLKLAPAGGCLVKLTPVK